ncbi:MAG: HlyD family efflux transporter periplasmic adaptor subunit [Lachnospiraceae bacterium]|jgi:multidrug efflux pump subunit AcrA (membrane-fusion protein)|nr:HlyD family efflux transporter periplasmic adaptor subunit [Lachnospiraceae bacterium]
MKKRRKRIRIAVGCAIVAGGVAIFFFLRLNTNEQVNLVSRVDLTWLAAGDVEYTISGTGRVESNDSHKVYASQNYRVEDVLVEVGDFVKEGQQLLALDTTSLKEQIETKEISMANTEKAAALQVKSAQDTYLAAKKAIDNGTNSSLMSAEASVRNAHDNLAKAEKTYNEAVAALENGTNSSLNTQDNAVNNARTQRDQAQEALENAKNARDKAKKAYNDYKPQVDDRAAAEANRDAAKTYMDSKEAEYIEAQSAFNLAATNYLLDQSTANSEAMELARAAMAAAKQAWDLAVAAYNLAEQAFKAADSGRDQQKNDLKTALNNAETQVESAEKAYASAQAAYDSAVKMRGAAYDSADSLLDDYRRTVESAQYSYENALKSQEAAAEAVQNSLQQNRNSLASAQLNANTDLSDLEYERLLKNLDSAQVTADYAGTITAVYAAVGSAASGILFVIEDTGDLVVETTVSEYDVGTVRIGMPVAIKSEATGEDVYDGTVMSIAPTSNKTMQGDTDRSGDALFATKIKVTSKETGLRIGMSVRINYIVERQEEVLAVPYDAVYINDEGASCIMVLETENGRPLPEIAAAEEVSGRTYVLREIPVDCGLENDVSIVVSGKDVRAGLTVVNSPANYREMIGQSVTLTDQIISNSEMNSFMGMRF